MVLAVTGRVEWEPVLSVLNDSHHFEHTTTITERGARLDLGLAVDYFGWEAILFRRNSINSSCTATFRFSIFSRTSGCLRNLLGSRSLSSGRSSQVESSLTIRDMARKSDDEFQRILPYEIACYSNIEFKHAMITVSNWAFGLFASG
ncbi:hypothetical protein GJ496_008787 [Pomphorhynchus laevis]|nr:hypothetical protein GJ496_008787 [Pomphorhynchus laevis]